MSELNRHPHDDFSPDPSIPGKKYKKDEYVQGILTNHQAQETTIRRARVQLQHLVDGTAQDVNRPAPEVTFGEYKYPGLRWVAIRQEDPEAWVKNRPVRNVPYASLAEVLRRGGTVSATELAKINAAAASQDPHAPVLQPNPPPAVSAVQAAGLSGAAQAQVQQP